MVAIQETFEQKPADSSWWAFSRTEGWVVLDRSLPCNRTTTLPEVMQFTRCADWTTYTHAERAWDYEEAENYLESLSYEEAAVAEEQLAELQEVYAA